MRPERRKTWIRLRQENLLQMRERKRVTRRDSWRSSWESVIRRSQNGSAEFPIVKDTTPNMMNPRLYITNYNKTQGQQFDRGVLALFEIQQVEKIVKG